MATNPMQRKARNSFLLGMLLMLVISGAVIALILMQLIDLKKKETNERNSKETAYVLGQDVKSGQVVTPEMLVKQEISRNVIPSNAIGDLTIITNYSLQDKEGNDIYTLVDKDKNPALFIKRNEEDCQLKKEQTNNYYIEKDRDGNYVSVEEEESEDQSKGNKSYPCIKIKTDEDHEEKYQLKDKDGKNVYIKYNQDGNNIFYTSTGKNGEETQLEDTSELSYENNLGDKIEMDQIEKQYVELNNVPLVAKVTMNANTLITTELLSKSDNLVQDDVRKQEYNMIVLPTDLVSGDYVDIRLMLPSGQDFIVISKKEVQIPQINNVDSQDTIWMNFTEEEILHMSCAIIDAYQINGAKLYATKYTEAGMQQAATPTYPANESTLQLLRNDPNILSRAMSGLSDRYRDTDGTNLRNNYINNAIGDQAEQLQSNIQTNMQESITNSKNSRKEYLDSLAGVVQ